MSPKIITLQPDRSQLDPNFNGYKLSLDKLSVLTAVVQPGVDRVLPSPDQYSLLHAKLFGTHNHLVGEEQDGFVCTYFVDKNWAIQKVCIDPQIGVLQPVTELWRIPERERTKGSYNICLKFASDNIAVISDGTGALYVLNTGQRMHNNTWEILYCDEVIGQDIPCVICDVLLQENELHCLLLSITQKNQDLKHFSKLSWVTLSETQNKSWGAVALRELQGKGVTHYAHFDPSCKSLYIISDDGFKFTVDSQNPIGADPDKTAVSYTWSQSGIDVTLSFPLLNADADVAVDIYGDQIYIKINEELLLSTTLGGQTDSSLTTWLKSNGRLLVTLVKAEEGALWEQALVGIPAEKDASSDFVKEAHRRLAQFCSDIEANSQNCGNGLLYSSQHVEECDFEDDRVIVFERIDCISHEVTHKANSIGSQILLTAALSKELPPAFAVRHDVDACLWQPFSLGDTCDLKHEGTLLAFSYVQASKQRRKFSASAPDLNYSVICEFSNHLFIYRQHKSVEGGELRNRLTGRRVGSVAIQQLVSLNTEEILGVYATNNMLFVLTENSVNAVLLP